MDNLGLGPDDFPLNAVGSVLLGAGKLAWGATSLVGGFAWNVTSLAYVHGLKGQLMDASKNGQHGRVGRLIWLGADVDMRDEHGRTALWIAASLGHKEVVEKLAQQAREGKCSLDSEDKCARTPLWIAVSNGHKDVAQLLMQHSRYSRHTTSEMINKKDKDENSPLKMACLKDNLPLVQLLCVWGADLHSKDKDGLPPLVLATKLGYHGVAEYLKKQLLEWQQRETQKYFQRLTNLSKDHQEGEMQLKKQLSQKQQKEQFRESLKENIKETLWKASCARGTLWRLHQAEVRMQEEVAHEGIHPCLFALFDLDKGYLDEQQGLSAQVDQMYMVYNYLESEVQELARLCAKGAHDLLQKMDGQNQALEELRTTEKMVQWQLAEAQKYKVQQGRGHSKASTSAPGANSRPAEATRGTASQPAGASTSSAGPKLSKTIADGLDELNRILSCASDHECLKLNPGANVPQIRRSFNKMVLTVHPDKWSLPFKERAGTAFQRLKDARDRLIQSSG